MTDDLLARIDDLTRCPLCREPMDQAAWTLYGVCDDCAHPADVRTDAVDHLSLEPPRRAYDGPGLQRLRAVSDEIAAREEAGQRFADAVAPFVEAQQAQMRAEAGEVFARLVHGDCDCEATVLADGTEEHRWLPDCPVHGWRTRIAVPTTGRLFETTTATDRCDCPDAAVGFDGTWESGVAIHCRAHGYRLLPDPPEPKPSPPKPLSTWHKIIRWCQRRLARSRRHR